MVYRRRVAPGPLLTQSYIVHWEPCEDRFQVLLTPNTDYAIRVWVLEYVGTDEEAENPAHHFVECYSVALQEGYSLEAVSTFGLCFINASGVQVPIMEALSPTEMPIDRFRAFVHGVNLHSQSAI
jgi:hypothetical protein